LARLADAVWPRIDGPEEDEEERAASAIRVAELTERCAAQSDESIIVLLDELRTLFDEEEERRSRVETKAAGMLAAISLSVSLGSGLLFAGLRAEFQSPSSKSAAIAAFLFALASLVYLVMAARHSLRALGRTTYFALGPEDLLDSTAPDPPTLRRRMAIEYATHAFRNRGPTNRKVDAVHLAQKCVRNGVVTVIPLVCASIFVVVLAPVHPGTEAPPPASSSAPGSAGSAFAPSCVIPAVSNLSPPPMAALTPPSSPPQAGPSVVSPPAARPSGFAALPQLSSVPPSSNSTSTAARRPPALPSSLGASQAGTGP
jgi:hypothetical protein